MDTGICCESGRIELRINKIEGLVVVLVDIDQLRRVQQELRDARDFARSVIKGISLPLAVLDEKLKIRFTNEAFCGLTGSTDQLLEHRFFPDLAAALWGLEQPFQSRLNELRTGGDDHFGLECRIPGEQARVFQVDARTLQPDGERFLLLTFEDISAHKEIERLLKAEGERLANKVETQPRRNSTAVSTSCERSPEGCLRLRGREKASCS